MDIPRTAQQPVNRLLAVVTNAASYQREPVPTGLWLGELTHFLDIIEPASIQVDIASPHGGESPLDPESLTTLVLDKATREHHHNPSFMERLQHTLPLSQVSSADYDGIYLTGGHGTMFDFVGNPVLQRLIAAFYDSGKLVSAVCHGVCGLLDVQLHDGSYLVAGRRVTGYAQIEEWIARRNRLVPFSLEARLKSQGADYRKAFLPLLPYCVTDGTLITGQNPFSAKRVAEAVLAHLQTTP
jgi:putative intracellular protease/amidase